MKLMVSLRREQVDVCVHRMRRHTEEHNNFTIVMEKLVQSCTYPYGLVYLGHILDIVSLDIVARSLLNRVNLKEARASHMSGVIFKEGELWLLVNSFIAKSVPGKTRNHARTLAR